MAGKVRRKELKIDKIKLIDNFLARFDPTCREKGEQRERGDLFLSLKYRMAMGSVEEWERRGRERATVWR
jgi:hypothetical protein